MELLNNLGINGKLLIAQIVNFLVLLFILKKFAYGPVLKLMTERTDKIEKGLKDAEASHKKLAEISEKEKAVLVEARKAAQEIVAKAEEIANKTKEEIVVNAKAQSEKILADGAKKMEQERVQMMQEVKGQVAELIILATGKVIDEKMTTEKDGELINKTLQN